MSMSPDNFRHEDVTFQVPTTSPPQGDPAGQLLGWLLLPPEPPLVEDPPLPEPPLAFPPFADEPPLPPPLPPLPPLEPPQPFVAIAEARTTVVTSPTSTFRMRPLDVFEPSSAGLSPLLQDLPSRTYLPRRCATFSSFEAGNE
jgi:hypothetical protein